jgi:hypothetical protein
MTTVPKSGQWAERRGKYAVVPNSDGAMQEASWKTYLTRQGGVKKSGDNLHQHADCDLKVAMNSTYDIFHCHGLRLVTTAWGIPHRPHLSGSRQPRGHCVTTLVTRCHTYQQLPYGRYQLLLSRMS